MTLPAFLLILAGIVTLMATFALYPGGIPDEPPSSDRPADTPGRPGRSAQAHSETSAPRRRAKG